MLRRQTPTPTTPNGIELKTKLTAANVTFEEFLQPFIVEICSRTQANYFSLELYSNGLITGDQKQKCDGLPNDLSQNEYLFKKVFQAQDIDKTISALEKSHNEYIIERMLKEFEEGAPATVTVVPIMSVPPSSTAVAKIKNDEPIRMTHQESSDSEDLPGSSAKHSQPDVTDTGRKTRQKSAEPSQDMDTDKPKKKTSSTLIMNNYFRGLGKNERKGSDEDVVAMEQLFGRICSPQNVTVRRDVESDSSKEEDKKLSVILEQFKKDCVERKNDYCVIVLMTHGGKRANSLVMADFKKVDLYQHLVYLFDNIHFPEFTKKEKIFLIQACQDYDVTLAGDSCFTGDPNPKPLGNRTDIFIGFSCMPLTVSWRYIKTKKGALYIRAINQVFGKYYSRKSLAKMHDMVNDMVVEECGDLVKKEVLLEEEIQEPTSHSIKFNRKFCF